jgi:poly-gamma-glutamate synthesis protein (capsule biosynthesis protein)
VVSRRVRRRRRQVAVGLLVLIILIIILASSGSGPSKKQSGGTHAKTSGTSALSPSWRGDGKAVTLAFGGDVHFEHLLETRLNSDPQTALGPTVTHLMAGSNIAMADFESALTNGKCTTPAPGTTGWGAPATALTAFKAAGLSLVSMANPHGEDCGTAQLANSLKEATAAHFPIVGIGTRAAVAYAPYRATIDGQRIAIFAATEVFPLHLASAWTATATKPGLASAIDDAPLIAAIQAARKTSDTVVVYLFWGTPTKANTCPVPQQPALAQALVKAGADIVVGSGSHVQEGAGYLGQAYVDYGLGNLAFYDTMPPETSSGSLLVTVTGRHIDGAVWRPALISTDIPQMLAGASATTALSNWTALRGCSGLAASSGAPIATVQTETQPAAAAAAAATATTTTAKAAASTTTAAKGAKKK